MAHKNRRSPPRRWSPEPRHSFKPAKETISPRDFGFVPVQRRRLVSFAWCPLPPRTRRWLAAFCRFTHRFTHWRVHVAMAFFAGDPRGSSTVVIRRWYIMHRAGDSFAWFESSVGEWPRGGREICEELSKDEVYQSWTISSGEVCKREVLTIGEELILKIGILIFVSFDG